eukprot:211549-Hanusia_phi.AAC.1
MSWYDGGDYEDDDGAATDAFTSFRKHLKLSRSRLEDLRCASSSQIEQHRSVIPVRRVSLIAVLPGKRASTCGRTRSRVTESTTEAV